MKIGSSIDTQIHTDAGVRPGRAAGASSAGAVGGTGATPATDQATVSAAGTQLGAMTPDFDAQKVEAIRNAIREGRFSVNPGAIADRLIADAAALLGPRTH